MPCTWIVIPVFNRREITLGCLANLRATGVTTWSNVLVADGGSTDGTPEAVLREYPEAVLIQGKWWWMEGIRAGMAHAQHQGVEVYVWLNDDCRPRPGSVEALVRHAADRGVVSGGVTRSELGAYAGMRKTPWGLRALPLENLKADGVMQADSLVGNFVAWPAQCVDRIGLPDATLFPHLCADHYYTLEAGRAGCLCELVGSVEADDVHPEMGWARQSILRGDQPVAFLIKWQMQWHARAGLLPELRLHHRFWGPWGWFIALAPWCKKWMLLGLRILLPDRIRKKL